ncbi:hypothetical protein [Psychromonas hadalis]|uniref:hypothetical protein n=1 Tax=Psychromonas hadalis TaxID=211669 RepID=UPI0003B4723D|nr:hypothetical protein [Psychromonas hadalis]
MRHREHAGCKRVATSGFGGNDVIIPHEGQFLEPKQHWITKIVSWNGARLVAYSHEYSDYQEISSGMSEDESGEWISTTGDRDFNSTFNSTAYEIVSINND